MSFCLAGVRTVEGFGGIPTNKPILFVGNHQTLGLDSFIFIGGALQENNMLIRGLAHPFFSKVWTLAIIPMREDMDYKVSFSMIFTHCEVLELVDLFC